MWSRLKWFVVCTLLQVSSVWTASISVDVMDELLKNTGSNAELEEDCSLLENAAKDCSAFWGHGGPPLLLVSFDGFRSDYLTRFRVKQPSDNVSGKEFATPTIRCLAKKGVRAPFMMPSYPTITFPNHYSIVTGLYPESHGIVGNQFYDPDLNANFSIRYPNNEDPVWWQNGEPIWYTLKRQGKKSGTFFWPGSSVQDDRLPNYWFHYNKSVPFQTRVDQILKWFDLPHNERPDFATLYFEEPDSVGHKEGPDSPKVTAKLTVVDNQVHRLVTGMIERKIFGCINMIFISDHGMAPSPPNKWVVDLGAYIPDLEDQAQVYYGPVTTIRPDNNSREEEERIQKALQCQDPHMRIFNKLELPYRLHFVRSRRIPSLILDLDLSWRAAFHKEQYESNGDHGWDNLYKEMQAIFIAYGPSFKNNLTIDPFENIQLYNLMCALTNVTPAENNGTWGALHHLLIDPPDEVPDTNLTEPFLLTYPPSESIHLEKKQRTRCAFIDGSNEFEKDFTFNETNETNYNELIKQHAPFGNPLSRESNNVGLLLNDDYSIGFNLDWGLPLWTTYKINTINVEPSNGKWRLDVRLESNWTDICKRLSYMKIENITFIPLFPPEFATNEKEVWLDTNMIEIPSSVSYMINAMNELLIRAANRNQSIYVINGPSQQHVPAIYYIVYTCTDHLEPSSCPASQLDVQCFILPIKSNPNKSCMDIVDYIPYHVATLKDVERVTGLNFFPHLPSEDKVQLLTRTTLETKLVVAAARFPKN